MDSNTDWLCEILQNVQLEQFYVPIRDQLQITRLAHFDYVHAEDLEKIGISKPGVRRLLDAVRKKKLQLWNRKFWNKLFGSSNSITREKTDLAIKPQSQTESRTTCIILEKDIVLHNELGNGSFGVVRRGEWRMSDQTHQMVPVAVKVLKADAFSQPGIYDDFRREVESMHSLKHPNLIKLHGVVFHPLMMVCELAPMGALLDYIRAQDGKISLNFISKWSGQVAAGMAHLEKSRFLHRDLACRNILLSNLELVKIGDFGLMRALPDADDCYVMSERRRVPFPWCAPESLRSRQFSHASDVWMFAVALWEMYSFGEEPWMGLNGSEILRLIMREGQRLSAPNACPPDVYMLMMQCWELNPKERPTFAGIQRYMETNKFETAIASLSYRKQGQMTIEAGDAIVLIDKRPELHWWKGQNQRSLEVGLFPSTLVTAVKSKNVQVASAKMSPKATNQPNNELDESEVTLRKRRTIESAQPSSTRAGNNASKHFNYNKLINDRTLLDRVARSTRDNYSKSLNHVKEDLLIDLDLPPATTKASPSKKQANSNNISILDAPIDVPETNHDMDWGQQSIESLPTYCTESQNIQSTPNLYGAKSLDGLNITSQTSPDPFDTSQFWPRTESQKPNCSIQLDDNLYQSQVFNTVKTTTPGIYNNMMLNNSHQSNLTVPNSTIYSNNAITNRHTESINESLRTLADMSLDDRISESLNLRSINTNEGVYANTNTNTQDMASTSHYSATENFNDFPVYSNFDMNPNQQQLLLETKDYYAKFSTPSGSQSNNDYEKNMYKPKFEEKLQNFSDSVENSKNYSALKYQNVDYGNVAYDEVSEEAGNVYSEIEQYSSLYDEVYEPRPHRPHRPHRPAPPRPYRP